MAQIPVLVDWNVIPECPYQVTKKTLMTDDNTDVYNRNVAWLLISLSVFATRLTTGEIVANETFSAVDLQRIIRMSENRLSAEDFIFLVS